MCRAVNSLSKGPVMVRYEVPIKVPSGRRELSGFPAVKSLIKNHNLLSLLKMNFLHFWMHGMHMQYGRDIIASVLPLSIHKYFVHS